MGFPKGVSGNPGGRSRAQAAVARLIRDATRDGAELVEFALKVMRDDGEDMRAREYAHQWLSDRSLGKPLQSVDVLLAEEQTPEQLALLDALRLSPHERRLRIEELKVRMPVALVPAPTDPDEPG